MSVAIVTSRSILDNRKLFVNETFDVVSVQDHGLVSFQTWQIFQVINYAFISGPVSFFGIGANVINIVVFCKQGLKDSMNISLFGLAIADLLCLVTMLWTCICYNPLFIGADLPFNSLDVMLLTGGYTHNCFNRVTSFITAFITLERCLCITMPLKVKTIITPTRTKIIIISIFVIIIAVFTPFYAVNKLEWKFNNVLNKTIFSLVFGDNREEVETIIFLIQGLGLSTTSLISVIICTIILITKLNKKSKWRHTATSGTTVLSSKEQVSVKDKKVVKMVTFISIIFITCYLPATINMFMMAFIPDFSFGGKYTNIYFIAWSVTSVLQTVNSSVNILVYYRMSTKYKLTFTATFCRSGKNISAKVVDE